MEFDVGAGDRSLDRCRAAGTASRVLGVAQRLRADRPALLVLCTGRPAGARAQLRPRVAAPGRHRRQRARRRAHAADRAPPSEGLDLRVHAAAGRGLLLPGRPLRAGARRRPHRLRHDDSLPLRLHARDAPDPGRYRCSATAARRPRAAPDCADSDRRRPARRPPARHRAAPKRGGFRRAPAGRRCRAGRVPRPHVAGGVCLCHPMRRHGTTSPLRCGSCAPSPSSPSIWPTRISTPSASRGTSRCRCAISTASSRSTTAPSRNGSGASAWTARTAAWPILLSARSRSVTSRSDAASPPRRTSRGSSGPRTARHRRTIVCWLCPRRVDVLAVLDSVQQRRWLSSETALNA